MRNMVTEEYLKSRIKNVNYVHVPDTTTVMCTIHLVNGYTITATESCVDPANFDYEKGKQYAYENAFNKLWPLEGYLLKEELHKRGELVELLAELCHNVNRLYCEGLGDLSQPFWKDAPEEIRESARNGVKHHFSRDLTPKESHNLWMAEKKANGWVHGLVKDFVLKTHPCMVPYEMLPKAQQVKDELFATIVKPFKE